MGSYVEREPEWSRDDVEALLAFMEAQRVGPHGHPMSEAVSRDGDPSNRDRKWDWHVPLPELDFAQQALNDAKAQYRNAYPDADVSALKWRVVKRYPN